MKRAHQAVIQQEYFFALAQRGSDTIDLDSVDRPTGACNRVKRLHTTLNGPVYKFR